MSIKVMSRVWEQSESKGSELLTLLALADWSNDMGVSWPSLNKLHAKTRMSPRQQRNITLALSNTPELHIEYGIGKHGVNLYFVFTGMSRDEITEALCDYAKMDVDGAELLALSILNRERGAKIAGVQSIAGGVQSSVEGGAIAIAPDPSLDTSLDTSNKIPANAVIPKSPFTTAYHHPLGDNLKAQTPPDRVSLNNPGSEDPIKPARARNDVWDAFALMLKADTPDLLTAKRSKIGLFEKSWRRLCAGQDDLKAFDFVGWLDQPGQANGYAHKLKSVASLEAYIGDWLAEIAKDKAIVETYTIPEPDDSLYSWSDQP